jgi:hypothetical protein
MGISRAAELDSYLQSIGQRAIITSFALQIQLRAVQRRAANHPIEISSMKA